MAKTKPQIVHGRSCVGCTMCCKLLSIEELNKPPLEWCKHCDVGKGCKIYGKRPKECRSFYCGYLVNPEMPEHWKPSNSRMVTSYEEHANRIVIFVDPDRPDIWKKEPYYSQIKEWAVLASQNQGQVIVWQGKDAIAILPDKDKNLGPVRQDQLIITSEKWGPLGTVFDVFVMEKNDPRLKR